MRPAGLLRDPKNIFRPIFIRILRIRPRLALRLQRRVFFFKSVRDILKENQLQNDVFIFRRVHVVAEFVRHQPELLFKPNQRIARFVIFHRGSAGS